MVSVSDRAIAISGLVTEKDALWVEANITSSDIRELIVEFERNMLTLSNKHRIILNKMQSLDQTIEQLLSVKE